MNRQPEYNFVSLREAEKYVLEAYFIDGQVVQDYTLTYKAAAGEYRTVSAPDLLETATHKARRRYLRHLQGDNT